MAGWESAAILGGVNLLGYPINRAAEDRSFQRNVQLMKMQNDFNVNMWNRTNAYNSPSNQVKLLRDAGINPAMVTPGTSQASEVTSASASVPYNQDAASPLRDAATSALSALQTEAQLSKLRNEIKYQKMVNEDYELRLAAAKEGKALPFDDIPSPDSSDVIEYKNGEGNIPNVTVSAPRKYNEYQEDREMKRRNLLAQDLRNKLSKEEYDVYLTTKKDLKKIPHQQLRQLEESVKRAVSENTILENDVKIAKQFGINPNDDGWKSLVKIALRDPDAFSRIIDALVGSATSVIGKGFEKFGNNGTGTALDYLPGNIVARYLTKAGMKWYKSLRNPK